MAESSFRRIMLGRGENLTTPVTIKMGVPKEPEQVYTLAESKARLLPMISNTESTLRALPEAACPGGMATALLTMHPQFIAKSYFPQDLCRTLRLTPVGSRAQKVTPGKMRKGATAVQSDTVQIFLTGTRNDLDSMANRVRSLTEGTKDGNNLMAIEEIHAPQRVDLVRPLLKKDERQVFEVAMHATDLLGRDSILESFRKYVAPLGATPNFSYRLDAGGLIFFPMEAEVDSLEEIAKFTLIRVLRGMPTLRPIAESFRSRFLRKQSLNIPAAGPLTRLSAAVFDGGMPEIPELSHLVTRHDPVGIMASVPDALSHGLAVTSALLFGPLDEGVLLDSPSCRIDHYRVYDVNTGIEDPFTLYAVLKRILQVLDRERLPFLNLSMGPCLPIEDDEVNAWTTTLEQRIGHGYTFATVAVGNHGMSDRESGNARIQPPSDMVNAVSVGAADSRTEIWDRAGYSCFGPGRTPGGVKPDILAFGGSDSERFGVLGSDLSLEWTSGTSFASPLALRVAVMIKSRFDELGCLALKAMLIHCARAMDDRQHPTEIGWGRIVPNPDDYILCGDNMVRVVYQGRVLRGESQRFRIPMPPEMSGRGKTRIKATFCVNSEVDPEDSVAYTRSGLSITFRPKCDTAACAGKKHPSSRGFFSDSTAASELAQRTFSFKWETVLQAEHEFGNRTLREPVFDVRLDTRRRGMPTRTVGEVQYALVLTIINSTCKDLYELISSRYVTELKPLTEQIPVRIQSTG